MRKATKIIVGFGLCGLLLPVVFYAYFASVDYSKQPGTADLTFGIASIVLCPPSLLSVLCIDCEVGTGAGMFLWSVISLLNCDLYLLIGAIFLCLRSGN